MAPNLMVSPECFDTSITSARASLSSSSAARFELLFCLDSLVLRILSQVGIVSNRFLITAAGRAALESELKHRIRVERPRLIQRFTSSLGDQNRDECGGASRQHAC